MCVGHSSCASSATNSLPPQQVSGTKICDGCTCPTAGTYTWPTFDAGTICSDSTHTQTATGVPCTGTPIPPAITCPTVDLSKDFPGEKNCCNPVTHCCTGPTCGGDDIDHNLTMMGGIGCDYCCPSNTWTEFASCSGAGRKWFRTPNCKCECSAGLASSCTMGNGAVGSPGPFRKFNPMAVSGGRVESDACKCVCDDSQVNATECATRMGSNALPMVYEEATCSCVDAPLPNTACECLGGDFHGITRDFATDACDGIFEYTALSSPPNPPNKCTCTCEPLCSHGITVDQARINCAAEAGMNTCPGNGYRFEQQTCDCVEPFCKRTQCVAQAFFSDTSHRCCNRHIN